MKSLKRTFYSSYLKDEAGSPSKLKRLGTALSFQPYLA